ncbi:loganic acid O-methyltransferase-like [Tripterygium wilfordii]|uniref:loganic acid O-methyltransferase-like n=1 Tax=Tripterygium wilfordii TaxID=458696 RepID=UPI0018F8502F|nr:loganic acid O-methyltransferase-like [Tripterygium wilfordii]
MVREMTTTPTSMNGGDGEYSYTRNSSSQGVAFELVKSLINEGIATKLDLIQLISPSSPKMLRIADLGCSVGPNTFISVQEITNYLKLKCLEQDHDVEFQVFFNDQFSNDFNTLFKNLPSDRQYFAAGVPGSFHDRLFPKNFLHFMHCSYSLHWLSSAPKELVDQDSPAYNKGRIYYAAAPTAVVQAYSNQFAKDITSFLNARSQEVVPGGLMTLVIPGVPDGVPHSQCGFVATHALIEACLIDIHHQGLISEAKIDSFNMPIYSPTAPEMKALIEKNGCFSIEKMESIIYGEEVVKLLYIDEQMLSSQLRAVWEGIISEHFGNDIVDELFDQYAKRFAEAFVGSKPRNDGEWF